MDIVEKSGITLHSLVIAFIVIATLSLPACQASPSPIPIGTDKNYYGYIRSGEKFGVQIGDARSDAKDKLSKLSSHQFENTNCNAKLRQLIGECEDETVADTYRVKQFMRDGIIILEIKDEEVSAIIWEFSAFPHVDS